MATGQGHSQSRTSTQKHVRGVAKKANRIKARGSKAFKANGVKKLVASPLRKAKSLVAKAKSAADKQTTKGPMKSILVGLGSCLAAVVVLRRLF